jgi:O-antigen ligase
VKAVLRRILFGLIGAAILAVAAGVMVAAAAFALYALVRAPLGAAGAAGVVALAAAILIGIVGLIFALLANGPKRPPAAEDQDLLQRLIALAKERPIISTGALIGFVTLAIRNPALIAIVVKAFLDPNPRPTTKKARF